MVPAETTLLLAVSPSAVLLGPCTIGTEPKRDEPLKLALHVELLIVRGVFPICRCRGATMRGLCAQHLSTTCRGGALPFSVMHIGMSWLLGSSSTPRFSAKH
jgi:hypothetical protein